MFVSEHRMGHGRNEQTYYNQHYDETVNYTRPNKRCTKCPMSSE